MIGIDVVAQYLGLGRCSKNDWDRGLVCCRDITMLMIIDCHYSFFFSSRRRHTRLQGDWSSDVCYSDLKNHQTGKCARAVVTGASGTALGAISRTAGSDHAEDDQEEKSQRGGGGLRAKAGRAAVARADVGRAISLRTSQKSRNKIFSAARTSHRPTPQRRRGQGDHALRPIRPWTHAGGSFPSSGTCTKRFARSRPAFQRGESHAGTKETG